MQECNFNLSEGVLYHSLDGEFTSPSQSPDGRTLDSYTSLRTVSPSDETAGPPGRRVSGSKSLTSEVSRTRFAPSGCGVRTG